MASKDKPKAKKEEKGDDKKKKEGKDKPKEKGKDDKKEAKREKKQKPEDELADREAALKQLNDKTQQLESQMKEVDLRINRIMHRFYASLHKLETQDEPDEANMSKDKIMEYFKAAKKEEQALVDEWIKILEEQQKVVQEIRLAVCEVAKEKAKTKQTYALGVHTSQLLSQTTLSSADDLNIDWDKFGDTLFNANTEFGADWESKAKKINESPFSTVYAVKFKNYDLAAKKVTSLVPKEEIDHFKGVFKQIAAIRASPLLAYIAISDDGTVILTEKARNGPLNLRFKDKTYNIQSLAFERRVKIARGLAEGMNFLHQQTEPIIHGRLKPSNVLLTSDNKVKVADYGRIVKLSDDLLEKGGYAPYTAPEIFEGKPRTAASDVYSYGMVLYFLFLMKEPFEAKEPKTLAQIKSASKDPKEVITSLDASSLPKSLVAFIKTCISVDPAKRGTFLSILRKDKPFDDFIRENFDNTRGEATKVWDTPNLTMDWHHFEQCWKEQFGAALQPTQQSALKVLMGVPLDDAAAEVKKHNFEQFLSRFGPISNKTIASVWVFIDDLVAQKWFHGDCSLHEARERLRNDKANNQNYLVRFKSGEKDDEIIADKPFTIYYRKETDGKPKYHELSFRPRYETNKKAVEYVEDAFKEKKVEHIKPLTFGRSANLDRITAGAPQAKVKGYVFSGDMPAIDL